MYYLEFAGLQETAAERKGRTENDSKETGDNFGVRTTGKPAIHIEHN